MGMFDWLKSEETKDLEDRCLEAELRAAEYKTELDRWRALKPKLDKLAVLVDVEPGEEPLTKAALEIQDLRAALASIQNILHDYGF